MNFAELQIHVGLDVLRRDGLAAEDEEPVHDIVKFADVARPVLLLQQFNRLMGETTGFGAVGVLAQEMVDAFPERNLSLKFEKPLNETNTGTAPFTRGILSSRKIRQLGWKPGTSLREGIIRTVQAIEMERRG